METSREFSSVAQLSQFPGASVVTRHNASDDPDTGTAETVALMQNAAIEDSSSPQVRAATLQALRQVDHGNTGVRWAICQAIYRWISSHVRFRSDDPVLVTLLGLDNELDLLIRPARLLTMAVPAEDCDGFTMLACSMLLCAGVPCEVVTIKADPEDPTRFSHVYNQALMEDGRALVMDCSQGAQHGFACGWEAPHYFDRKTWGVMYPQQREERKGMHGLGCDFSGSGEDCTGASYPATGGAAPFDWNSFIGQLTAGGLHIATMQATPVGYVQTPTSVANYGSGVAPGIALGGGLNSSTLLIGGGLLLAALLFSRK